MGKCPESHLTLYSLEVLGGLLFGLPGMISVGWFYRKQKRECEKQASVGGIRDETVIGARRLSEPTPQQVATLPETGGWTGRGQ